MIDLRNGDCLELLKDIPDGSVDLILTDPPYNISQDNNFKTMGRAGIDFGKWDYGFDVTSYLSEAYRVLKNGGSLVTFNSWKLISDVNVGGNAVGFETKDLIRFEKSNPMPRNRDRRYISDYEVAIWFVKPKARWTFNRQDEKYQRPKFVHSIDKGLHPTQKSLGLMTDLINIHSNNGDVVLDCFMGSGSTGVACVNTNRKFIGIELDPDYFKIAEQRINNAMAVT